MLWARCNKNCPEKTQLVKLYSPASKVFFLSQLSQKFRDLRNLTENANQSLIVSWALPTHPLNPLMRFSNGLGIMSSLLLRMQDESVIRKVQLLHRLLPLHNIPDQKVTHYACNVILLAFSNGLPQLCHEITPDICFRSLPGRSRLIMWHPAPVTVNLILVL